MTLPKTHQEKGTPFPYWLDFGYLNTRQRVDINIKARELFGNLYTPLNATYWKLSMGRFILMFRSEEDRFLFEISSSMHNTRIDPSKRN